MTRSTAEPRRGLIPLVVLLAGLLAADAALAQRGRAGDDAVLRHMILGTQALAGDDWARAEAHFEVAAHEVLLIWGDSPEAARARSHWYEERVKPFKGEAYERMMALYYLGLIYLERGDFGNAQAAFRNAVMQDAFAEEEQHQADAALPIFLQGWALQAQGSRAEAENAYRVVATLRPDFPLPSFEEPPNVVVLWETGTAPRKVNDGVGGHRMRLFRGRGFEETRVRFRLNGGDPAEAYPMEDIFWQASTRGARPVDFILDGKAEFAASTANVGSALSDAAAELALQGAYSGNAALGSAGTALGLAGVAALVLSSRARPAADVRAWDNLPDLVHVQLLHLPPGEHRLDSAFFTADGAHVPGLDRATRITIPEGTRRPQLVWISARDRDSRYLPRTR